MLLGTLVGSTCLTHFQMQPPNMFQQVSQVATETRRLFTPAILVHILKFHLPNQKNDNNFNIATHQEDVFPPLLPGLHWKDYAMQHLLEFDWHHRHSVLQWAAPNRHVFVVSPSVVGLM